MSGYRAICVFGGQFGSEGKGSLSEWYARQVPSEKVVVFGDGGPNSGHTCSVGSTRNIPAASFFADTVILGPDAVICVADLEEDLEKVNRRRAIDSKPPITCFIHQHAAIMRPEDYLAETQLVKTIGSTGSGTGKARARKQFERVQEALVKKCGPKTRKHHFYSVIDSDDYFQLLDTLAGKLWIFECSQGVMLDVNWGYYPFVTSRSTLPRVAIERNGLGLGAVGWEYVGVYRLHPIRTGGASGAAGGRELTWKDIGVAPEIATVTKRMRRVFEWSIDEFVRSVRLSRPDTLAFTHLDYLNLTTKSFDPLYATFLNKHGITLDFLHRTGFRTVLLSDKVGEFTEHNIASPVLRHS